MMEWRRNASLFPDFCYLLSRVACYEWASAWPAPFFSPIFLGREKKEKDMGGERDLDYLLFSLCSHDDLMTLAELLFLLLLLLGATEERCAGRLT